MDVRQRIASEQLVNSLSDEPVMGAEEFIRQSRTDEAALTFATSRSGKQSSYAGPDEITQPCVDAISLMGVEETDGLLNLGAPEPHLSGWGAKHSTEALGASVYNDHFDDYTRVIEDGHRHEITAMFSIPSIGTIRGEEIESRYGPPSEVFPNLELGLFSGEMLRPAVRQRLKDQWGLDRTREFYGSSEVSIVAGAVDESRRLVPLLHRLIIEIEVDGEILDIREPTEPIEGSILLTDPHREAVNLTRYRQGDRVRVYPDPEIPRIEPLGREDNAVNLDGALLYPADLYEAVGTAFREQPECVPYALDSDPPAVLEVFVVGATAERTAEFFEELFAINPAVEHAVKAASEERIVLRYVDSIEETPLSNVEDVESRQVVFQSEVLRE